MNPWLQIELRDYEAHMSHKNVNQLQTLSRIVGLAVKLFSPHSTLVLGAAAGNGFEHFEKNSEIYAVDINKAYLDACSKRFGKKLRNLHLLNIDVDSEPIGIEDNKIDLAVCHLFLEYAELLTVVKEMKRVLKPRAIVNIVIQKNNGSEFVSETGITGLNILSGIAKEVDPVEMESLFLQNGFTQMSKIEEFLPGGKSFMMYNFRKN